MNIKKLKIIGLIIAFIIPFPLHFLYDLFPNFFTSIFSLVNESIWEHMKLLFGGIIFSGIIQKLIVKKTKLNVNNVCFSNFVGAISSIPIFLIIYLPIFYIFKENIIVTIIIMFIAISLGEVISYKIMKMKDLKLENLTIIFTIIVYIIFTILSYYPIKIDLFIDQKSKIYGPVK